MESKIADLGLHSAGLNPVPFEPVLEDMIQRYKDFPEQLQAVLVRVQEAGQTAKAIAWNSRLRELALQPVKRFVGFHEFGHDFCRHDGSIFPMIWGPATTPSAFDLYLDRQQERQCDYVASFFSVPRQAMLELWAESSDYVAGVLEIPAYAVELRWQIWRKFGR